MAREDREVQNCAATCHESIAEFYLEDTYEDIEAMLEEALEEARVSFDDLDDYVYALEDALRAQQKEEGVTKNGNFEIQDHRRIAPVTT